MIGGRAAVLGAILVLIIMMMWWYKNCTVSSNELEGLWESSSEFNKESGIDSMLMYLANDDTGGWAVNVVLIIDAEVVTNCSFNMSKGSRIYNYSATWPIDIYGDGCLDWPKQVKMTVNLLDSSMTIHAEGSDQIKPEVLAHLFKN